MHQIRVFLVDTLLNMIERWVSSIEDASHKRNIVCRSRSEDDQYADVATSGLPDAEIKEPAISQRLNKLQNSEQHSNACPTNS